MSQTLVLNRNWTAIAATPSWRALVLMCRETALAVCPESYATYDMSAWIKRSQERELTRDNSIGTPNFRIEKPQLILVTGYGGVPYAEVNFTRRNLYKRDKYRCQYCNRKFPGSRLTIDHVHPRSKGGENSFENCVTACEDCNSRKADRTLKEAGMKLSRRPKKPRWNPVMGFISKNYPDAWKPFLKSKA